MKHPARKSLGYHIILAARAHRTRIAAALAEMGLFPGQEQALKVLGHGDDLGPADGLTMGALARLMRVRPPTMSKTIARLEVQGLVQRQIDPKDGRIVTVALTDLGRAKLEQIDRVLDQVENEMISQLDAKDVKRLVKLLRKVTKALTLEDRIEEQTEELEPVIDD